MATYAIGDVQGCYDELLALLAQIEFQPDRDRLWFTGDLVNRGPKSLEVLRFVRGLGPGAITVLGNHDIHLLALAHAGARRRRTDTLDAVLKAADREVLLEWLRGCPLLHHDPALDFVLVHAGLAPQWTLAQAGACAGEVETALRANDIHDYLIQIYGDQPDHWSPELTGFERLRFITNALVRMRFCDAEGRLDLREKGPPGKQPHHLMPWYMVPGRASAGSRIIFGHWSTHYLGAPDTSAWQVHCVDTGCYWGGTLTAMRLDDLAIARVRGRPPEDAID